MTPGKWILAVLPVALVVGCGGSSKKTMTVKASPTAVALDTQGQVFCKLVDKVDAERQNGEDPIVEGTNEVNAATAAIKSSLPDLRHFGLGSKLGLLGTSDAENSAELDSGLQLCRAHGWVGTP